MNLNPIAKITPEDEYRQFLQRHTKALCKNFPMGAKNNWGAARKAINIFIRDCLYNLYLNKAYKLSKVERWMEIPLDKDVGMSLYEDYSDYLPRWKTIKTLDLETSDMYQECASLTASEERVSRVHLDLIYWRNGEY